MFDTASQLYNKLLDKYFDDYCDLEGKKKKSWTLKLYKEYIKSIKKYQMMILMIMIMMDLLIFQTCHH